MKETNLILESRKLSKRATYLLLKEIFDKKNNRPTNRYVKAETQCLSFKYSYAKIDICLFVNSEDFEVESDKISETFKTVEEALDFFIQEINKEMNT